MDNVDNVPEKTDTVLTPNEKETMNKYFGETPSESKDIKTIAKNSLYVVVAFAIFANPYIDPILSKAPYMTSPMHIFALKIVIFFLLLVAMQKYMIK